MYRALRVDKLIIQALETTLGHVIRQDWQAIPALRMIFAGMDEIRSRAERVASSSRRCGQLCARTNPSRVAALCPIKPSRLG